MKYLHKDLWHHEVEPNTDCIALQRSTNPASYVYLTPRLLQSCVQIMFHVSKRRHQYSSLSSFRTASSQRLRNHGANPDRTCNLMQHHKIRTQNMILHRVHRAEPSRRPQPRQLSRSLFTSVWLILSPADDLCKRSTVRDATQHGNTHFKGGGGGAHEEGGVMRFRWKSCRFTSRVCKKK